MLTLPMVEHATFVSNVFAHEGGDIYISSLRELEDIRHRRLEQLRREDPDIYRAVMWLKDHRREFEQHVFDPIVLEVNVRDNSFMSCVEATLGRHLKVCHIV